MSGGRRSAAFAMATLFVVTGCSGGQQSILDPAGERAESIFGVWELMLALGTVVWIVVVVALGLALVRKGRRVDDDSAEAAQVREAGDGRSVLTVLLAGEVVTALIIAVLVVVSASVLRSLDDADVPDDPTIEIVGHQYWWEVNYPDQGIVTANEIHIPAGERVAIEVSSDDVIHSFWVPELGGKIDMIPGKSNSIWLEAEEPGTYWGQCAEYCGTQHALMRVVVVAHDADEYEGWLATQSEPAPSRPSEEESIEVARGREVFLSSSCVYCHTVQGTAAAGELGPDLTHLASRENLGAGILENNRGNLAAWVLDPQAIKPGNLMPGTDLEGEDLQSLLTYLESLE
ncbi:cytochrome c oxidase subunit II [Aeromicrobium phragmitis]|uniref:cytochrome-c oxidase n=1 Tax=Aeromicrobium phragmitis TaxID=2478914 RepID=A0A3L8PNK4_9ACTN|nr:cytochrome c oxidase subunit II [Aeromicrobium phragmitis]RLV56273.1 cytochrome c oxidase subunit II [Aeromicrobium phragmitis]